MEYLLSFPLPEPHVRPVQKLMDNIAGITGCPAPYMYLAPHLTLAHISLSVDQDILCRAVKAFARVAPRPFATFSDTITPFGKEYLVLPVLSSQDLDSAKELVDFLLAQVDGYEKSQYDDKNTFHLTLAKHLSSVFDAVWPQVMKQIPFEMLLTNISFPYLALHQRASSASRWEEIARYTLR